MRHFGKSLRKELVRAAGMTSRGMRMYVALRAVETERLWISMDQEMRTMTWGENQPPRFRLVSVPRSLRTHFGRYVEALP